MYAILQKAPDECVQCFMDKDWYTPSVMRSPHYTYRLHPDVELIDDTAPESEYEFVEVFRQLDMWRALRRSERRCSLTYWEADLNYICIGIEDAEGKRAFIESWDGPYTYPFGYPSVDVLIRDISEAPPIALVCPLTPKAVVFRRGPHGQRPHGKGQ